MTSITNGTPQPGVALVDVITGLHAHGAILAALLRQRETGVGQHINCSLLESLVPCKVHGIEPMLIHYYFVLVDPIAGERSICGDEYWGSSFQMGHCAPEYCAIPGMRSCQLLTLHSHAHRFSLLATVMLW